MEEFIKNIGAYAGAIVTVLYTLDKLVKLTPTKKDDFVVDILLGWVKRTKKETVNEEKKSE